MASSQDLRVQAGAPSTYLVGDGVRAATRRLAERPAMEEAPVIVQAARGGDEFGA